MCYFIATHLLGKLIGLHTSNVFFLETAQGIIAWMTAIAIYITVTSIGDNNLLYAIYFGGNKGLLGCTIFVSFEFTLQTAGTHDDMLLKTAHFACIQRALLLMEWCRMAVVFEQSNPHSHQTFSLTDLILFLQTYPDSMSLSWSK